MTTTTDDELLALCDAATPGPWWIEDGHRNRMIYAKDRDGDDTVIAEVHWWIAEGAEESITNAKLIAAASPDRVKALVMRVRELEDTAEGLTADLQLAVEVAFKRGAREWARLNYPKEYARLVEGEAASGVTQDPLLNADDRQAAAYFSVPAGEGE